MLILYYRTGSPSYHSPSTARHASSTAGASSRALSLAYRSVTSSSACPVKHRNAHYYNKLQAQ